MKYEDYIDISYPLDESIAIYPGNPAFGIERVQDISRGDSTNVSRIIMGTHTGTHIDAPAHFIFGGNTIDQIPLDRINGNARVVDAMGCRDIDADLLCGIDIESDDIILFRTDNSNNWECDRILDDYVTLTYEAAEYLSKKRIKMVGIDYLTVERPRNRRIDGKSVHRTLLTSGIMIVEAVKLGNVDVGIYDFFCFPLRIIGLDGCPVRCALRRTI